VSAAASATDPSGETAPVPPRPRFSIPVLHAVTSDEIVFRDDFLVVARRVMGAAGSRGAIHLRAPRLSSRVQRDLAVALVRLQEATGCWLVINDRVDVALVAGARGVQLTSRSMRVRDARTVAPGLAIGASAHASTDAESAVGEGADWLVAGRSGEVQGNGSGTPAIIGLVERIARGCPLPVIAIGGIRPEHVGALRRAGAYGVAAIRGVWDAADAEAAVIDYLSAHDAEGIS
jgi:thiazole tautomerase (transcriptional regulator TenI)